ncbi:major capsid protein [Neobacillus sedimentimangrovi]|uniref:major capsid protein n=1 Tax=Neobacillus sedimentimangrovi TaxID=2699460 RepID=UPI0013D5853F|nr:major capsid protein [Neobacillus sedimentimangrovi]
MTTKLADVIQPEVFTPYVIQRTMEKSELIKSGIVVHDAEFDRLASGPNTLVNMPYWNDLTGDSEVMDEDTNLTAKKITASKDVARKHGRANMWGANNLAAYLSGDDPAGAIADLVASYWDREMQKILLATLKGVFAASNMTEKTLDITNESGNASLLTGETFIDANQVMGDAKDSITGVMMHSFVESYLAKRQLIEYVQESEQNIRVPYFMNKRVIVDDSMPYDTTNKIGEMYLFGSGAIALGNGSHPDIKETEVDRDKRNAAGQDYLINRKLFILHPRGVKWTEGSVAKTFPTNTEIETGSNWSRVYEPKAIRIVKFKFRTEVPAGV